MVKSLLHFIMVMSSLWQSEAKCGALGSECIVRDGCTTAGICQTQSGCTNRTLCTSFGDQKKMFDVCACPPQKKGLMTLVAVTSIIGTFVAFLVPCCLPANLDISGCPVIMTLGAVGITAFYSIPIFLITVAESEPSDSLAQTVFTFIVCLLVIVTLVSVVCFFKYGRAVLPAMILGYCAAAGFQAFTFSVLVFCSGFAVFFGLVSIVIRCNRSGWEDPSKEDASKIQKIVLLVVGFPMRVVNFVLQVSLVTYALGDLWDANVSVITDHLKSVFASLVEQLPGVGHLLEYSAVISAFLNEASEQCSSFLLGFSSIWTPNMVTGYISVAVFEIAVVTAAFIIVLSDVLLIVSPREGSGCLGQQVGDFVSRAILYVLQSLASASHVLLFALTYVRPLERPELSEKQEFGYTITTTLGIPLTGFYVGLTLLIAIYILLRLWSGSDAGLQNLAVLLMEKNGIFIPDVEAKSNFPCAFLLAFLGIWPQKVLDAFEVGQRTRNYRLEENDVLLATVNALSFPLYVLPFGAVVAKLGEYLNQNPIYVSSRGFNCCELLITMTYVAEYVLVLIVAIDTLESIELGLPEQADIKDAAGKGAHSPMTVALCLLAITLVRLLLSSIREWSEGGESHFMMRANAVRANVVGRIRGRT